MTLEGVDLPVVGGGLSLLVIMVMVIKLAFQRLDKQDTAWIELLNAAERRAEAAENTLRDLRQFVLEASARVQQQETQSKTEFFKLNEKLRQAESQIKQLEQKGGETQ